MLAASIDFEVELETITFVDFTKAGTFHSTDVDKCVGLAVVTRDKAEALHRVEELDRTGSAFAGQFALRGFRTLLHRDHVANNLKVCRRNLPAAIDEVEFERLPFGQAFEASAFNSADVNEHIFPAVFTLNEAETLVGVEEFYSAAASANDLCGHAARSATAETVTAATAAAEAITAAAAATRAAAAETVAAATRAATAEAVAATKAITTAKVAAAHEGVETLFTKTVALVASPTATPSIKTHKAERTFVSPKITIRQRGRIAPNLKANSHFAANFRTYDLHT